MLARFRSLMLVAGAALVPALARAQTGAITFAEHIGPLVYAHCSSCHHEGDVAPFPLMSYQQVVQHAYTIEQTTASGFMPPWKADPTFSHFLDENVLSAAEKQQISTWIADGMPRGDVALEPAPPTFAPGSTLGTPDMVVSMAEAFTHQGDGQDMYQVFVLPVLLPTDRDLKAIEFRPGNRSIVHHAIIAIDTTGQARQRDAAQLGPGYTSFGGFGFTPTTDNLATWVPGARARAFPPGMSKKLFRRADLIVQVHYGPTGITQVDSSAINLFFAPPPTPQAPAPRQVRTVPISVFALTNGPFVIPANQVKTFNARFTMPYNVSLVSTLPHCHLLGQSWEVFAVKPAGDTIPLIRIPAWDFNWQGSYRFPNLIPLPAGSRIYMTAVYDNTADNPRNPFSPPRQVMWGEETTAEMFVIYFDAVPYLPGDENLVLGTRADAPLATLPTRLYPPAPNPTTGAPLTVGFTLGQAGPATVSLLDAQGRTVRRLTRAGQLFPFGGSEVTVPMAGLAPGLYLVTLDVPGGPKRQMQRVVVE
ncbi:MAG: T9SS type A sorting domain-containing protein [Hymenobacteraceae bacterium]|nr:T9SS type A sorting domain-containing protein [Hymenobacteraceae bacterium]